MVHLCCCCPVGWLCPAAGLDCRQDRSFNVQWFKEDFDIDAEQIEALYQFTKFQFDCGNYSAAAELLNVSPGSSSSSSSIAAGGRQAQQQCELLR